MSLEYIRKHYSVPAQRGGRVVYSGDNWLKHGTITGAVGPHLRIRLDGDRRSGIYHPTWEIRYLAKEGQ